MKRKVPIKNIFYMLSYVWDDINLFKHGMIGVDDDFSSADLMADLFIYYSSKYTKRGIIHEYLECENEIRGIKGRINFEQTLNNLSIHNGKLVCNYDEYIIDNRINQIIKSVALVLFKSKGISASRRIKLNHILHQFSEVSIIELNQDTFQIKFNKNNLHSKHLINACLFIFNHRTLSTNQETFEFQEVYDNENEFALLFEKFVYQFLKLRVSKDIIYQKNLNWNLDGYDSHWLPKMKMDIFFDNDNDIYIIDTKYSKHFYSTQIFDTSISEKLITGHLYQINAYLTNFQTSKNKIGILVYPKPFNSMMVNLNYTFKEEEKDSTKKLQIKTIDLEADWKEIENQLLSILM